LIKYIFAPDMHIGFENAPGKHLRATHDEKAINCMLEFARDLKPDVMILGGDNMSYEAISHWRQNQKRSSKDLNLKREADTLKKLVIDPLKEIKSIKKRIFMMGNHERFAYDFIEANPSMEGSVEPWSLTDLKGWDIVDVGEHFRLGKNLAFVHGDQIGGGQNPANAAVNQYPESSIRFGHFHTFAAKTQFSALDKRIVRTAIAVPCLCKVNPFFALNKPNRQLQGFNFGYVDTDETFHDYTPIIIDGKAIINGKKYSG
jgi:hypothetical protein